MVKGHGPENAKIAIVGNYATKDEVGKGYALTGFVGNEANKLLRFQPDDIATHIDKCYKTLYIKDNFPGIESKIKRVKRIATEKAMAAANWDEIISNELKTIAPNVVIALGEHALNGLTGLKGIHKYRGSILNPHPQLDLPSNVKIIPTVHPRDLISFHKAKVYVNLDYNKALRYQNNTHPFKEDYLLWICKTYAGLQDFWKRQQEKNPPYYTWDIETFAGFVTYMSFCFDGYESISIPLVDPTHNVLDYAFIYKGIQSIFGSKIPVVNQNIKYDKFCSEHWGFRINNIIGDTMLAGHTMYPELPKNLGFYTSIYTDLPYHKDEGKDFNPLRNPNQLAIYNAKDALVTWRIYKAQVEDLKETKIYSFYTDVVMPLFHVYCKIDRRGICVDDARRKSLLNKYTMIYHNHQGTLDILAGRPLNVKSFKQVGEFVYEDLKCPKHSHKTESGTESYDTAEEVLEEIYINELGKDDFKVSILKELIATRKLRGIVQFLEDLKVSPDGKLRTTYRLEGTESGRTSGSSAYEFELVEVVKQLKTKEKRSLELQQYGHSFQTLPKHGFRELENTEGILGDDLLEIFVPSSGYAFVEGDGSQAEARVVAVLANDWTTLALMDKTDFVINEYGVKDDLHTITATWTTEKLFEQITSFDREDYGKRPRHAGNYDQTAFGLAKVIHKPIIQCARILTKFHNNAQNIRRVFHKLVREFVIAQGYLQTPYGRRRDFFAKRNDSLWRVAYSYIPQSLVSDHYKLTILPLESAFSETEARTVVEKHDSLMAEVRIDKVKEWARAFKKFSEREIDFRTGSLPVDYSLVIPSEINYSEECWSKKMKGVEL